MASSRRVRSDLVGPLHVRRLTVEGEIASDSKPLTIVLMHGFGAPGDDLVGLAPLGAKPGTALVFPAAPIELTEFGPQSQARAWWRIDVGRWERAAMKGDLDSVTLEIPDGLASAREQMIAMLAALGAERLVLGGFSQGAMLALDVALHTERALEGLVVLSGTMIAADEWRKRMPARRGLRVFQSHGRADPLLPYVVADKLKNTLTDAGLVVDFHPFDGGHGISPEVARELGGWLRRLA